jgi:hypothetical protein
MVEEKVKQETREDKERQQIVTRLNGVTSENVVFSVMADLKSGNRIICLQII